MTPVPAHTASQLRVMYTGADAEHSMLFHGVAGSAEADLIAAAHAVCTLMALGCWTGTAFHSAEYTAAGATVSHPVTWTAINAPGGSDPSPNRSPGRFIQAGGRDGAGKRVKLYLFSTGAVANPTMRLIYGASAYVSNLLDALTANDGIIGTVAGGVPTWKAYLNIGENDYITHRARG